MYISKRAIRNTFLIGLPLMALFFFLFWLWGLNIVHWFTTSGREGAPFWVPVGFALLSLTAAIALYNRNGEYGKSTFFFVCSGLLVIIGIVLAVGADYNRLNAYYNESVETIQGDAPDYNERAPFEVAKVTSRDTMLDTTGEAWLTKALSDEGDNGYWNTLIRTRGPFQGYEAIQLLDLPLFGAAENSDISFCYFNKDATLRHNGSLPHNNLSRAIYERVPLDVDFNADDTYGYCEGATPLVVVPLKQIDGFLYPVWRFYGLAIYNGENGEITILTDADAINRIPGPVYPMSLAATQRHALVANGEGWWAASVAGTSGYVTATSNSEVQLRREDSGESDYITTLRPRGTSSSIVGVGYVSATTATPGKLNTYTLSMLPREHMKVANAAFEDDIRTAYGYMPDIVSGATQVFEITAHVDGGWVASLGRERSVNYRAYITTEGVITLYDRTGRLISQGYAGQDGDSGSVGEIPTDLSSLTTEELENLIHEFVAELAGRVG